MGADGHIAYFDKIKVNKILEEIKKKYPKYKEGVYFVGYCCDYTVNGKEVCLSYWGDDFSSEWGTKGSQLSGYSEDNEAQKEFADRITKEALIVKDQEVWT